MKTKAGNAQRVLRLDRGELRRPETTPEGYLRLDGKIARTGIQVYRRADGTEVREYRPPDEVFDAKYLDSFAAIPLTDQHPSQLLDGSTATRHAIGAVASARKIDERWIGGLFTVWDDKAKASIQSGRTQLSVGYTCEVVAEPGEIDGDRYDCVQRHIVANHLALVDAARAGGEARARLDSAGNAIEDAADLVGTAGSDRVGVTSSKTGTRETKPMAIKIDGFTFECDDANAQAVIDRALAEAKKDGEGKAQAAEARATKADAALAEAKAKADALEAQAKADADKMVKCTECEGTGKVDGAKCDGCNGKGEIAAKADTAEHRDSVIARMVTRRVSQRAALVVEAGKILGANEKLDGKADDEIRRLVIAKRLPSFKLDGRGAGELRAAWDIAVSTGAPAAAPAAPHSDREPVSEPAQHADAASPTNPEDAKTRQDASFLKMNRGGK